MRYYQVSLFQKSVLKSICQDESIIATRCAEYQKYIDKIDFVREVKEEKYQDGFLKDIFENCLGYTLDSTNPIDELPIRETSKNTQYIYLEKTKKLKFSDKEIDKMVYELHWLSDDAILVLEENK